MELSDYLRVIRTHWLGALLVVVGTVAVAAGVTLLQPKVYAANANGFVTAPGSSDPGVGTINDALAKSRVKSYIDLAKSRATADRVIDQLGLPATAASLIGQIDVDQPVDTVLLKITARSSSPVEAQRLADAWVAALAEQVEQVENPLHKRQGASIMIMPVESAELPTTPVSPRVERNLALALVLGLLLALGYAVVRSQLDRRLRSPTDVERDFSVAVMGNVPVAGHLTSDGARVLTRDQYDRRDWALSEAVRKLRTNLAYVDVDQPPRVIVVTSPQRGDGKSTLATSLAAAFAVAGEPVTLVDADLRRPSAASTLGLDSSVGLTHVLIGRASLDDLLQQPPDFPGLDVLAAGSIPPNPSELLASQAMRSLLGRLAERGIVIVDAPPVLPVTDAAVLAQHADGAIVVLSHGRTLDSELAETLRQVGAVHGRVLGVVFNRVPVSKRTARSYYQPLDDEAGVHEAGRVS